MKLVYTAEAIDNATTTQSWADVLASYLGLLPDVAVYRPADAWSVTLSESMPPDSRLEYVNRAALDACDVLIAVLEKGQVSYGVPREIEQFASTGKPWALLTDIKNSFSLADAQHRFPLSQAGVDQACRWVEGLDADNAPGNPLTSLYFGKDNNDGQLPTRAHAGDAGFDLYVAQDVQIAPDGFTDVPCGVRIALPEGIWGRIVGRSSTLRSRGLLVVEGVLDTGYRGSLFAGVRNLNSEVAHVAKGDRIAQLVLCPNISPSFRPTWLTADQFANLPHDGRGDRGFGSTGN